MYCRQKNNCQLAYIPLLEEEYSRSKAIPEKAYSGNSAERLKLPI